MSAGELARTDRSETADDLSDPFRPVHGSGPLTPFEIDRIERVLRSARQSSGVEFSVFIGPTEPDSRGYAVRLHAALPDPDHSILIFVDPVDRILQIVTGVEVARVVGDAECRLAAATMTTSFVAHDLAGGLTAGIQQLGTAAYKAPTLHLTAQPQSS